MVKSLIKNYPTIYNTIVKIKNYSSMLIPDEIYLSWLFRKKMGKKLDLKNPTTFNEKIQWLKLNYKDEILTKCADKYEVRNIVREKIGENILNEIHGVYKNPKEINFDLLPNSFVLKINHGSGQNIICSDKSNFDVDKAKKYLKSWLSNNHYYYAREWSYKYIKPKIICEKFLYDEDNPLKDYKFFCFNGEPKIIQVDIYEDNSQRRNMYDLNWNLLDLIYRHQNSVKKIKKPSKLNEMIEYARILSQDFPFARIDFYQIKEHVIFGEITFYPASGFCPFYPEEYDRILGDWITLPSNN